MRLVELSSVTSRASRSLGGSPPGNRYGSSHPPRWPGRETAGASPPADQEGIHDGGYTSEATSGGGSKHYQPYGTRKNLTRFGDPPSSSEDGKGWGLPVPVGIMARRRGPSTVPSS